MLSVHSTVAAREGRDLSAAPGLVDALDCLRTGVTLFDSAERLVYVNCHFGYLFRSLPPRESLEGLSYEELIRLEVAGGEIAPADARDLNRFIARRRAQFRDGERRPIDIRLADGRIVEIKARPVPGGGWIALWSDVTAARSAQSRLEDAVALTADAFAFFDGRDRLSMCNELYASFYGFASPRDALGATFPELLQKALERGLVAGLADEDARQAWLDLRLSTHRTAAGAMTVELSTGETYLLRDRPTADGGRVVVFTDLTDRRRVERALEEQTRALEETRNEAERQSGYLAELARRFDALEASADKTRKTILRTMSHELKTPLNAIIGFSDLMLAMSAQLTPEQVRDYATLIHEGGRNLLRLINQILDLTKLAAGRYEIHRQRLDASAALAGATQNFETRAAQRSIAIDASGCRPGLFVEADDSAVTTMLSHLLDNAVAYTQSGGAVTLSAARDGGLVRLTVADNGPGVAPADIDRILRPFEQGGLSIAEHASGAGLGLTLVKALAEAQGGTLEIESAPGRGFRATVSLPAAPDSTAS